MAFGSKVGSITDLKKSLEKGKGTFIQYIPKNGGITGRFLEEPEEWVSFQEVFDQVKRKSYPVPDEGMPGYPNPDDRVSTRYLANFVRAEDDRVIPIQLPKDLANQLVVRYEKYGTVTDRDYELFRSGEGLDTVYGCTPESPTPMKLDKYKPLDLEKVLEDAYESVWGVSPSSDDDDDEPITKSKMGGRHAARRRPVELVEEPEEDEDDDEAESTDDEETPVDFTALGVAADNDDDADAIEELSAWCEDADIDPEEYETWAEVAEALMELYPDEVDADDEDDEEPEYTEDDLKPKPIGELRTIARDLGITTTGKAKPALIRLILANGSEEGGEEPF